MDKIIDSDEEIEYARTTTNRIINFSTNYLSENKSKVFDNLNIAEYKQTLYNFIEPIIIFHKSRTENYTISQDKIIFLSNYEFFKPACYDLKRKNISSIYDASLYILRKVLWFFDLVSSENDGIVNISKKQHVNKTITTFITLISILLELYFTNNKQVPDIKELIELIKNKLNIKDIKDILPNINSNAEFKLLACIINRFELDKREIEIKQLGKLNFKELKTKDKDTNKTIVDKNILKDIKNTLATFIKTSAITLVIIKAIVHIVNLITEKIPMLSSMINKGSNMISNGINSIGSSINLSSGKTGKTKSQKQLKPSSKHNVSVDTEIKNYASRNKDRKNNKDANNPLGNNGANNNLNSGKGKNITPDGGGSITPPSGTNGRIGSYDNPLIPAQNVSDNKTNGKRNSEIKDLEPEKYITDNSKITTNNNDVVKDPAIDYTENNTIQKNKEIDDDEIISCFKLDNPIFFDEEKRKIEEFNLEKEKLNNDSIKLENYINKQQSNSTKNKPSLQNTTHNSPENNQTSTQPSTDTDNTDNKTNNKYLDNNLSNNNSQNKSTSFQDKLKKETNNNQSIIKKVIEEHEENGNKSHTEIIETKKNEKGDDSPDNLPRMY